MLDQAFLETLRDAYWPLWAMAISAGLLRFGMSRRWCIGRTTLALLIGSAVATAWSGEGFLLWWQHFVIDLVVFAAITLPPRHYWQSAMGGLLLTQLLLHMIWGAAPELARVHWLGCIMLGFAKCGVLLLWSGGPRVELALARIGGAFNRLVLDTSSGRLA